MNYFRECFTIIGLFFGAIACSAQGTLMVTFDGPPSLSPGSAAVVQNYSESGMFFQPTPSGDGFTRRWSNPRPGWPDDGTPYLDASAGDSLSFSSENGSFGLSSVNLAGYSDVVPSFDVTFIGYHSDGSTISMSFSGNGINFQTYSFGANWSSGLTRVDIPDYGWSLDNLVVVVPEPSNAALFALGGLTLSFWQRRRRKTL